MSLMNDRPCPADQRVENGQRRAEFGLDTSTPAGKAMFQMLGVFAEFERAIIVERVNAGLARARAQGKRLGRPTLPNDKEAAVRSLLGAGTGIVKTARLAGVGVSAVQRIKAEIAAQPDSRPPP